MIWWVFAVTLAVLSLAWFAVHEGAHAVAVKAYGGEVTSFKPWPHMVDGEFSFARLTFRGKIGRWAHIAPYLVDVTVWTTGFLGAVFSSAPWGSSMALAVLIPPVVNTGTVCIGFVRKSKRTDLMKIDKPTAAGFLAVEIVFVMGLLFAASMVIPGMLPQTG